MRLLLIILVCGLSLAAYKSQYLYAPKPAALAPAKQLLQSTDGGKTWQAYSMGLLEQVRINATLVQDGELYVATEHGLFHSSDPKSGFWIQEKIDEKDPEMRVFSLFSAPSGLYASGMNGFFFKAKGSETWQVMDNALRSGGVVSDLVENPDGSLVVNYNMGVYKTADGGKSWKQVYKAGPINSLVAADGAILGSAMDGIMRSTNGGDTWEYCIQDPGTPYTFSKTEQGIVAIRQTGNWLSAASGIPLRFTTDGGKTWTSGSDQLPSLRLFDIKQGGRYLFCTHDGGISRSADGGKTWELVREFVDPEERKRLNMSVSGETLMAVVVESGC